MRYVPSSVADPVPFLPDPAPDMNQTDPDPGDQKTFLVC